VDHLRRMDGLRRKEISRQQGNRRAGGTAYLDRLHESSHPGPRQGRVPRKSRRRSEVKRAGEERRNSAPPGRYRSPLTIVGTRKCWEMVSVWERAPSPVQAERSSAAYSCNSPVPSHAFTIRHPIFTPTSSRRRSIYVSVAIPGGDMKINWKAMAAS